MKPTSWAIYYSLEDLITPILKRLRKVAEEQFGELPPHVVVGQAGAFFLRAK